MKKYLSFDIGGTDIKYGLLTEEGEIIEKGKTPSDRFNGQFILDSMVQIYKKYESNDIKGIAISIPGFVNCYTGYVEIGGAITDFNNFNIKEYLEKITKVPVSAENDVNCVALAEKWKGNAKELKHFLCMTIGTGIGGACFLDGKLYHGSSFMAGEFGFMVTNGIHNNTPSNCVLSQTGSMLGLRQRYAEYKKVAVEEVSGIDVFNACSKGDVYAKIELEKFYENLAIAISNLYCVLNPEKILIGGAVSQREDLIQELKWRIEGISGLADRIKIEACFFKNDAGIIGALYHHLTCSSTVTF